MAERLENEYLICDLDEQYAIEVDSVVEILEYTPVTPVPETPPYIVGILNLRGQVIPVVDLRIRFRKAPAAEGIRRCIVIVRFEGLELGLVVDNVLDMRMILPEQITPPPQVGNDYAHVFVKEIGVEDGRMFLIIDENKIVNYRELEFLTEEA